MYKLVTRTVWVHLCKIVTVVHACNKDSDQAKIFRNKKEIICINKKLEVLPDEKPRSIVTDIFRLAKKVTMGLGKSHLKTLLLQWKLLVLVQTLK